MINSMTGYGRGEFVNDEIKINVDVKTVNHRYLDISIKMPRSLLYMENFVKKIIKSNIYRGKLDLFINIEFLNKTSADIKIDLPLAKKYMEVVGNFSNDLGLKDSIKLRDLLMVQDIFKIEKGSLSEGDLKEPIQDAILSALNDLKSMREREGVELKEDLYKRLEILSNINNEIKDNSAFVVMEYKEKLEQRIKDILDDSVEMNLDRLANEVAYFADKANIDEEITRIYSHIKQFKDLLDKNTAIGKKLDFLVQELNREVNTIGSKTNKVEITKMVVEFKAELEKIREQIQNIE